MSDDLLEAIENGELTPEQLRELIDAEAAGLSLTFDEAVRGAESGSLPKNALGTDLGFLLFMLEQLPAA